MESSILERPNRNPILGTPSGNVKYIVDLIYAVFFQLEAGFPGCAALLGVCRYTATHALGTKLPQRSDSLTTVVHVMRELRTIDAYQCRGYCFVTNVLKENKNRLLISMPHPGLQG